MKIKWKNTYLEDLSKEDLISIIEFLISNDKAIRNEKKKQKIFLNKFKQIFR